MKVFDSLKICGLALLNDVCHFIGVLVILEVAFWISTNLATFAIYGNHSRPMEDLDLNALYLIVLCCVPPLLTGLFCGAMSKNIWIVSLTIVIIAAEGLLFLRFVFHDVSLTGPIPGLVILLNPIIMLIAAFAGLLFKRKKSG